MGWTALAPCALSLLLAGCSGASTGDARADWMREVLVTADRAFLSRDPDRVAEKYAEMASGPYAFMRGTLPWFYADLGRPDPARQDTAFLQLPEATAILTVGDPHPENASTTRPLPSPGEPEPPLNVEFVDLDAATWGPWLLDLRRASVGLRALAIHLGGCAADCQDAMVIALAEAYAAAIDGEPAGDAGEVFADYLNEAAEEGPLQERTLAATEWVDPVSGGPMLFGRGQRKLIRSDGLDSRGDGMADPTQEEQAMLQVVLADMAPQLPPGFRRLDAARRFGAGVSSLPALRFTVLYDLGEDGPWDDGLMNLREVIDLNATPPGRAPFTPATFEDGAQRVVVAARRQWTRPDADPLLAGACVGVMCFKALSLTSYFQDLERDKIRTDWDAGDYSASDLEDLGADLGGVLGRAHARAGRADGGDAQVAISRDLIQGGGVDVLVAELLAMSAQDATRLLADHARFQALLDQHGPLLGAENLAREAP